MVESWTGDVLTGGFKMGYLRTFNPADCRMIDNVSKKSDPEKIKAVEKERVGGGFGSYSGTTG